jgi:hypothetical protein
MQNSPWKFHVIVFNNVEVIEIIQLEMIRKYSVHQITFSMCQNFIVFST